jgi:hypothetical protein
VHPVRCFGRHTPCRAAVEVDQLNSADRLRIRFGPVRLEKLARQIKAHRKDERRAGRQLATRLRQQIADADRKLRLQVQALEDGVGAGFVSRGDAARIREIVRDRRADSGADCQP